ncbi:MAG TPA: insulinase family protein, partial [Terricaulis sp.]|nr:insulinase family protein [Terricaulis sp.]
GRAFELADAVIRYGDAAYADRLLAAIQATTAADVQRVARRVLNEQRRVVVNYLPEAMKPEGASGDAITTASTIAARPLNIPQSEIVIHTLAAENERQAPPAPGAPVDARIPAVAERTLGNGLRVLVASNRALPLISADLRIGFGSASDPEGRAGVAGLTADLLPRGTQTRSASEIASAIESLGAGIGSGVSTNSITSGPPNARIRTAFMGLASAAGRRARAAVRPHSDRPHVLSLRTDAKVPSARACASGILDLARRSHSCHFGPERDKRRQERRHGSR